MQKGCSPASIPNNVVRNGFTAGLVQSRHYASVPTAAAGAEQGRNAAQISTLERLLWIFFRFTKKNRCVFLSDATGKRCIFPHLIPRWGNLSRTEGASAEREGWCVRLASNWERFYASLCPETTARSAAGLIQRPFFLLHPGALFFFRPSKKEEGAEAVPCSCAQEKKK